MPDCGVKEEVCDKTGYDQSNTSTDINVRFIPIIIDCSTHNDFGEWSEHFFVRPRAYLVSDNE